MEEKRHDRELKFRLEMRREEREHDLRVLQMMMQTRGCNSQWTTPGQQESEYCVGGQTLLPLVTLCQNSRQRKRTSQEGAVKLMLFINLKLIIEAHQPVN